MSEHCPCGSGLQYNSCCQPYLSGKVSPPTPEALMRSRYTAYARHDIGWLTATWHPLSKPPQLARALSENMDNTQWLDLNVIACRDGRHENEGFVTFYARYLENQQNGVIHECSRFLREENRWYYVDGTIPPIGRNDPCPCGSGKKHKKCCGR